MSLDYSLIDAAAPDEFAGHYVRDFLGNKINLSYGNILSLTRRYCKMLINIFELKEKRIFLTPLSSDEDMKVHQGIITLNDDLTTVIFGDVPFQINTISVLLRVSPDLAGFLVYTNRNYITIPLYEYCCGKEGITKIVNNISQISSTDKDFMKSLEILKSIYES